MAKSRYEPQPGNPHRLTVRQHIHSAACINRFSDEDGRVAVLRRGDNAPFAGNADNEIFCARRAWDQKLERGLFRRVEDRFQNAVDSALETGEVDHEAITDYRILWMLRDWLNCQEREPVKINGVPGYSLAKDREEILESKGVAFLRGDGIPAHISRFPEVMSRFRHYRDELAGIRWRLATAPDTKHLICPDVFSSGNIAAIPINQRLALLARSDTSEVPLTPKIVGEINNSAMTEARHLVFAHWADRDLLVSLGRSHGWIK